LVLEKKKKKKFVFQILVFPTKQKTKNLIGAKGKKHHKGKKRGANPPPPPHTHTHTHAHNCIYVMWKPEGVACRCLARWSIVPPHCSGATMVFV